MDWHYPLNWNQKQSYYLFENGRNLLTTSLCDNFFLFISTEEVYSAITNTSVDIFSYFFKSINVLKKNFNINIKHLSTLKLISSASLKGFVVTIVE